MPMRCSINAILAGVSSIRDIHGDKGMRGTKFPLANCFALARTMLHTSTLLSGRGLFFRITFEK